jgi:hypothetical protein
LQSVRDPKRTRVGLDTNTARIVTALRPDRPLADVLADVAPPSKPTPDVVGRAGTELARRLLELGLVVLA